MTYINFSREKGLEYDFTEGEFGGLLLILIAIFVFIGLIVKA